MHEVTEYLNETSKAVAINKLLASFIALYMTLFDPDNNPVRGRGDIVFIFFQKTGQHRFMKGNEASELPQLAV